VSTASDGSKPAGAATDDATQGFLATVVILTVVMNAIGRGVSETFAVFLLPVEKDLGVSRTAMAATYSIYMLAYGIAAPFAGQVFDRFGARACYGSGLAALSLGYLGASQVTSLWAYYIAVGVLGGIGSAGLGMVAASSLLARWFTKRMASVASLPYAAMGAGTLLFPPLAQVLIDVDGWRRAYLVIGLIAAAAFVVAMLLPLARFSAGSVTWQSVRANATATGSGWTMSSAVRTGAFWWLFLAYFCTSVAAYSVLPHSVAFLVERGFSPLVAASAFGMTGITSAAGILLVGWAADRFGWRATVTVTFLSTMAGIASLMLVQPFPSLVFVYGFVLLFGAMQGARGPILVALVARIFAGGSVGTIFGALSMALGTGAAFGSVLSGVLYQATGNYLAAFSCSLIACVIALVPFRLARSIREERVIARW
jgi:MFS family permease